MEPSNRCCPTDKGPAKCAYKPDDSQVYVAGNYSSRNGILLIGDIFGMLDVAKRFADRLGKEGYLVVMPDFFGKDSWPADKTDPALLQGPEWAAFVPKILDYAHFRPTAERGVEMLRKLGCQKVVSIGLCWGARLSFDLARDGVTDACATAHPAFFTADFVTEAKTPVCVLPAKDDPPYEDVEKAVAKHTKKPSVFKRYDKLIHGYFGSRFDYDNATKEEFEQLDDAFKVLTTFLTAVMK